MKTNNVDFGKSFKFKTFPGNSLVYTCNAVDLNGRCKVSWDWGKGNGVEHTEYTSRRVEEYIQGGDWVVIPTEMVEIVGSNTRIELEEGSAWGFKEGNLLYEIKSFTTSSKHSVNIYNGAYEVFRSGEDMAYQCKDDETLRSVMQALSVLDKVVGDA